MPKTQDDEEARAKSAEHNLVQERQKEEILSVLAKSGITASEVETNGYWFRFPYKGMQVYFVNQSERLVGEVYRLPESNEEEEMLSDASRIASRPLRPPASLGPKQMEERKRDQWERRRNRPRRSLEDPEDLEEFDDIAKEFREEFLYEHFLRYGNPSSTVPKVLKLAEAKMRLRNKPQQ